MSNRRKLLWALVVVLALVTMVWIGTPNLLRSRIAANEASIVGKLRSMDNYIGQQDLLRNGPPGLVPQAAAADKKLIRNAELGLLVNDVRAAVEQIRKTAESYHGEIDKLEITELESGYLSAAIKVRVPASSLDTALAEFKKYAIRVQKEQVTTRDVT